MPKLKVLDKEFETIQEVEKWAWDTHKIELLPDAAIGTEEEQRKACSELEQMIAMENMYEDHPCFNCTAQSCHGCSLNHED